MFVKVPTSAKDAIHVITLCGIAIKRVKKGELELVTRASITKEDGLEGDCRGKGGLMRKRQVTVISFHQWAAACNEIGTSLPWTARRAGLCVSGYEFGPSDVGKRIAIPGGALLEITGETDPCPRMDAVHPGLQAALKPDWRGGVTCRVLEPGSFEQDCLVSIN